MRIATIKITVLLLAGVLSGFFVHAQLVPDALSLAASPSSPSPEETVTVQAATPTFDKNTAFFSWSIDGKTRPDLSGAGKDSVTFIAGTVGSATRVNVDVSRSDGEGNSASLMVMVSDLSLPWFAETYTPKWYAGKALPVASSVVSVVAVPQIILNGRALSPQELIYSWDLDDEEGVVSGIGKEVLRVKMSDLPKTSHHVKVTIEDTGKRIKKEGEIFLVASAPKVVIYPSSPLGGGEWRAAAAVFTASVDKLLDFVAEPFFFSAASKKNLSYGWDVAGAEVFGSPQNPHILTLNTEGFAEGTIPLSVSVDDKDDLVSPAFGSFNLQIQ